ncbi:MAG: hypothetical protein Q9M89_06625 [Persephonella sp.]|nr:hypothetical protein [Persephonella sp.]
MIRLLFSPTAPEDSINRLFIAEKLKEIFTLTFSGIILVPCSQRKL